MRFSVALSLAFAASVAAVPTLTSRTSQEVRAIWTYDKDENTKSIKVYNSDKSEFYGEAEGDTINTGDFAQYPISFNLTHNGFGTVSFGNTTYKARAKKEHSGGAVCNKMFNDDFATVDCTLPAAGSFTPTPVAASKEDKRQVIIPCAPTTSTLLVGDGDPHQNYYHKQISEVISCGTASSCTVGYSESESFTIGFTASATIDEWATFGFSVTKTWTTGNNYNCGGEEGDDICIWYNTAHTAVTVRNYESQLAICGVAYENISDDIIVKSPNEDNRGGGYYCVVGTCRAKGDAYWDNTGRAGGP